MALYILSSSFACNSSITHMSALSYAYGHNDKAYTYFTIDSARALSLISVSHFALNQVLTSKSCSEEGLEDATALLLHLSHGPPPARDQVLRLLLQGAATLGSTVATHIAALLSDLKAYNASHPPVSIHEEEQQPLVTDKSKKGVLQDR